MSRLLLVRHGETELNSSERFWGHTDVALSAAGLRQAEQLCHRLATEKIDITYSSNLKRASLTAETIASRHKPEIIICPELREIDFGQLEGLTFDEICQLYPKMAELWTNWDLQTKFPGGESVDELDTRVSKFLDRLQKHAPEETILIVAHSAPLRLLICHLLKIELWHWRQLRLGLASLSIVETYPQEALLTLLNDVGHLR